MNHRPKCYEVRHKGIPLTQNLTLKRARIEAARLSTNPNDPSKGRLVSIHTMHPSHVGRAMNHFLSGREVTLLATPKAIEAKL